MVEKTQSGQIGGDSLCYIMNITVDLLGGHLDTINSHKQSMLTNNRFRHSRSSFCIMTAELQVEFGRIVGIQSALIPEVRKAQLFERKG